MRLFLQAQSADSPGQAYSHVFDEKGGTIGRAPTNQFVLDDPNKTVSRVHAQILARGEQFFLIDRGSNPVVVNGQALGAGNEAALKSGDSLVLGSYQISVTLEEKRADAQSNDERTYSRPSLASRSQVADDPFADLMAEFSHPANPSNASPTGNKNAEPSFGDPFADLLPAKPAAVKAPPVRPQLAPIVDETTSDPLAGLVQASDSSIDELFEGLGNAVGPQDPFAGTALDEDWVKPNTASQADPLAALGDAPKIAAATQVDVSPFLQAAYKPPKEASTAPPPAISASQPELLSRELVGKAQADSGSENRATTSGEPLLTALLDGLLAGQRGPRNMPTEISPELMRRLGTLLRLMAQGSLQLLASRQEVKRELRAEMTMIAGRDNNPLKFSPTVEVALGHLLGDGVTGFMPPIQAIQETYADLGAHQLGVMAGTKAALDDVFSCFAPERLERRISEKTALDALFAANRKAKLWDQFCLLYVDISKQAQDDFHTLFGRAFVKAYDEQMAKLKTEKSGRG